jgi:hypothetical protein
MLLYIKIITIFLNKIQKIISMINKSFINIFFQAIVLLFLPIICFAQNFPIDKGSLNVGGDIRISSSGGKLYEDDGDRFTTAEIKPYFGYFFIKQLSLGTKILMKRSAQRNICQTAWGIGPTIKYFFGDTSPKRITQGTIYFFLEAGIFYNQYITENKTEDSINSGLMFSPGLGICYMLTNSVGLISGLSFQIERMNSDGKLLYGNTLEFVCGFTSFFYNQY